MVGTSSPSNAALTASAISRATSSCASLVDAPRCGVATTLGWQASLLENESGLLCGGSFSKQSSAAPLMWPDSRAPRSASSLIIPPRAALTMPAPFFIIANWGAEIRFLVESRRGMWSVRKSAALRASLRFMSSIPSELAASSETNGSWATTFIPSPFALRATSRPILPNPRTVSVLSTRDTPTNLDRPQSPPLMVASAAATFRAMEHSKATACSAAATQFPVGALTTKTPRSDAARRSILSTPTPARPTTFKFTPASSTSRVTFEADRTINPSYCPISVNNCSGVRSNLTSTSCLLRRISNPPSDNFSGTKTRSAEIQGRATHRLREIRTFPTSPRTRSPPPFKHPHPPVKLDANPTNILILTTTTTTQSPFVSSPDLQKKKKKKKKRLRVT
mmetsp:Transcript_15137/g.30763  ORF Transcript_15137/g.30763 Transcript_15137/m.30763 type:complete len:393 (-) Transcript_15137:1294-2472(-)